MIKKILSVLLAIILAAALISAYAFSTTYNPFTGRLDYFQTENFSGYNLTSDYCFCDATFLTNIKTFNQTYHDYVAANYTNDSNNLDGYDSSFFMPLNKSVWGDFLFNGGWQNGGVSIIGGDLFAQTLYVYNITSLNISFQDLFLINNLQVFNSSIFYSNIYAKGDIFQTTGLSVFNDILQTGRRENQAGNSGLGQGVPAKNTWMNRTEEIEKFDFTDYGSYKYSGGVFTGAEIILSPSYSNSVTFVNPATGEVIGDYPHGQGDYAFYGACWDGEGAWLAPFNSENFVKIFPNGTMITVNNPYGTAAFAGCVFTGDEVVFIPEESDYIAAIDPYDNSIRNVSQANISASYALIAFNGGFWDGHFVWMSPYNADKIVRVNVTDGTIKNYTHPAGDAAYVGAFFDGVYGWFLPANNINFLRLNPSNGEMTTYPTGEPGGDSFIGGCWDGISIWMAGEYSDNILKFDPKSGDVRRYAHGEVNEAYRGCIFDGQHVWFVPFQADSLARIRPPEFGEDSIYTSGNLNVGGNVGIGINPDQKLNIYNGNARIERDDSAVELFFTDTVTNNTWDLRLQRNAGKLLICNNNTDRTPQFGDCFVGFDNDTRYVGIGTINPSKKLDIMDTTSTTVLRVQDSSNTCDFGVDGSGWASISCSSDENLKENIHDVPNKKLKEISDWVLGYPLKEYTWKSNGEFSIGAIAQEIKDKNEEKVKNKDGTLFIETPSTIDFIVTIQEQNKRINSLEEENTLMKASLCKLGEVQWC